MPPIITLLTDFGSEDGYAAVMKGVILARNPAATIVDISHAVPPQDVLAGANILNTAYSYFPADTIHVVVVDPGVGTTRRLVVLQTPDATFVAPDNGVLIHIIKAYGGRFTGPTPNGSRHGPPPRQLIPLPEPLKAWSITNTSLFLSDVSHTFHGRDILSPVAAALSNGLAPNKVGPAIDDIAVFPLPRVFKEKSEDIVGTVIHVDRFGNLVTNLQLEDLGGQQAAFLIAGRTIEGLSTSYAEAAALLAIVGSNGYIELAVRNGNAAQKLGVGRGTQFSVHLS